MLDELTTTQRLLERAIDVISEHGEAGIRVWDIARDCGVSGPTLYRSFGSREGLVVAAQAERYRRSYYYDDDDITALFDQVITEEDFRAVVDDAARMVFNDHRTQPRADRLSVLGSALARPALMAAIIEVERDVRQQLAAAIALGKSKGWTRPDLDPELFTAWYFSMVTARAYMELPGQQIDRAAWDELTVSMLLFQLFG